MTMLTNDIVRLNDKGVPWSQGEIAKRCAVTQQAVSKIKASLTTVVSDEVAYTTKHGTISTMNTAAIGKPSVTPFDPVQSKEIIAQAKAIADADPGAVSRAARLQAKNSF